MIDRKELSEDVRAFRDDLDDRKSDAGVACGNFLDDLPDPGIDARIIAAEFRDLRNAFDAGFHSSEPIEGGWIVQAGWAAGAKAREWAWGKPRAK